MKNKLSKEAVDFVNSMLEKDARNRITMKEVLDHPWLDAHAAKEVIDLDKMEDISKNLTIFHK